jgi:chromosome segregation ATPase
MDDLDWLQKHMRDHLTKSARGERSERVLRFPGAPPIAAGRDGRAALSLVYQAAEVVRSIEDRANEVESRARSLAEEAIEQLRLAEKRIEELEAKQQAAEAYIDEANLRLQGAEEALKTERSRVQAAENQLPRLEMRARAAEARAIECENALSRIEEAIRTQLLRQGRQAANRQAAAA